MLYNYSYKNLEIEAIVFRAAYTLRVKHKEKRKEVAIVVSMLVPSWGARPWGAGRVL